MDIALQLLESGNGAAGVERLVHQLHETRRTMSAGAWRLFVKWVLAHPVTRYAHADPFTHRAFTKPRGYAGDAVMMDYIYGIGVPPVEHHVAASITAYTTGAGVSAQSVRYRRQALAEAIDREVVSRGRPIEVTAMACGHARELASAVSPQQKLVSVTAIDQDEASLEVVEREYGHLNIRAVPGSVRGILTGRLALPASDSVYSAGLYDYLTQPVACRLTQRLFESVTPGGRLLLANFMPGIPDAGYMESLMDWHLIYRDDAQMRDLTTDLPSERIASVRQFHDPFDAMTFLEIVKR